MSVSKDRWDKREAFAALIEKGDFQGYIITEDIATVFPEVEDSEDRLERLQTFFRTRSSSPTSASGGRSGGCTTLRPQRYLQR